MLSYADDPMPATIVDIDPQKTLEEQVAQLQLPKVPPIILLGDFDAALNGKLSAICSRVLAAIALEPGALIVDNARCSSCAAMMGTAAADEDVTPPLLGVIPHDRVQTDIDSNHDRIVRLPAEWTDTTKFTFQVIDAIAAQSAESGQPIAILFGGKDDEKRAAIRCSSPRRQWPIIVIKGSGGLADEIGQATAPVDGAPAVIADPDLRRIVEDGSIYTASIDGDVDDISNLILGRIAPRSESARAVAEDAWRLFNQLDAAAIARQRRFRNLELWLVWLAVAAAFAAILSSTNSLPADWRAFFRAHAPGWSLHALVLVIPIVISIIGAYNGFFRDGIKWILFRGAAEALKREIYRFRTKSGNYSDDKCGDTSREAKLAARVGEISNQLEHSEANKTNLPPGAAATPEQVAFLDPNQYMEERVRDQIGYFRKKTSRLAWTLRWSQLGIFAVGGVGTLLAAVHLDVWVALATATVSALATKLQADQVENSLVQYNQALAALRAIELWWTALSTWEKSRQKNIDLLVDQTERTLEAEMAGWVQQMQSALEKLTEKEPEKASA
jgi:hypothetical protein